MTGRLSPSLIRLWNIQSGGAYRAYFAAGANQVVVMSLKAGAEIRRPSSVVRVRGSGGAVKPSTFARALRTLQAVLR
jgi:hypothetical protein